MKYWDTALAPDYGSRTLAVLRFAGFALLGLVMLPAHLAYALHTPRDRYRFPLFFHRVLCKLTGLKVRTHGSIITTSPAFFVANHVSYLDVPVLASLIPASFIAKAEVATWPGFGFLAKLQGTVFIERRSTRAAQQRDQLTHYLAEGRNLMLFPEGTSSDGQIVLPFKSSLFGAIENAAKDIDIMVQPVSITCTSVDGLPITQNLRHFYGWYGDLSLMPHMWQAFKCGRFTVDVVFHAPIHANRIKDRKQLAALCHSAVAKGVEQCISGRWLAPPEEKPLLPPPEP